MKGFGLEQELEPGLNLTKQREQDHLDQRTDVQCLSGCKRSKDGHGRTWTCAFDMASS